MIFSFDPNLSLSSVRDHLANPANAFYVTKRHTDRESTTSSQQQQQNNSFFLLLFYFSSPVSFAASAALRSVDEIFPSGSSS
jgi:hypothetical protein